MKILSTKAKFISIKITRFLFLPTKFDKLVQGSNFINETVATLNKSS